MEYKSKIDPEVSYLRSIVDEARSQNVSLSYHVGNHDPWHLDYMEDRLGFNLVTRPLVRTLSGRQVYLSHGDEEDVRGFRSRFARHLMRTAIYYNLYRLLPAGIGQTLPRWISRKYADPRPNAYTIERLKIAASDILESKKVDCVIFGHSHQQSHSTFRTGDYFNSGSWFIDLSYLEILQDTVVPRCWHDNDA
ncbi:MAG: hypothetical protein BMS9Abin05_0571 [Rhodothermia bacterium]|nr:MAG: hypothetical protein BMS9Abin05_0571 [Rhodothermia bacterium]